MSYDALRTLSRELQLVSDAAALLGWDQEVLLPAKGVAYRASQMAWFSGYLHERFTSSEVGDWITAAEDEASASEDPHAAANLREWRRQYTRSTCLPKKLVEEFAESTALAQAAWAEARGKSDFALFAPHLAKLVALSREHAERWGYEDCLYDALIDQYERGATTRRLGTTLGALQESLVPVVREATAQTSPDPTKFTARYPREKQEAFNREVAEAIGFDFEAGRIDTAVHPFCSGMAPFDTRLTTRYDEEDFLSSLFGVLHETGHGLYEQGLERERRGEPVGAAVSLGVHESQSRLWENHVGRSRAFWEKWLPRAADYFPNLAAVSPEEIYEWVNRAELSPIRVEADEVTYDLHILLRFEMERDLFAGNLEIAEVPGEWNRRFESLFGLEVESDARGCLQDIHWSFGIFGYFPTYSLGNINAAHLVAAARRQEPALAEEMDRGEYARLLDWTRTHIHRPGSLHPPDELITRAAGGPATAEALVEHLRSRYLR